MTALRLGSLCTGYAGLDAAVGLVLDVTTVWHADPDPGASAILAHHWPDVPNLGDITAVDWSTVPSVDVLTAGFPCQDVSLAGRRAGIADGTRSGLWAHVAHAISVLQPRIVVIENVPGLLSARAHSGMGPGGTPVDENAPPGTLRAAGAVLGDLASLGFDAEWTVLPASAVGAAHRRERVVILAWPADTAGTGLEARWEGRPGGDAAADAPGDRRLQGRPEPARVQRGSDAAERGGAAPADADDRPDRERPDAPQCLVEGDSNAHTAEAGPGEVLSGMRSAADAQEVRERAPRRPQRVPAEGSLLTGVREHEVRGSEGCTSLAGAEAPGALLPGVRGDGPAARSPRRPEPGEQRPVESEDAVCLVPSATPLAGRPGQAACGCAAWATYAPAIHRWEHVLERQAPPPTEPTGKAGAHRLSARAVEFMMGLPAGHVTGVPGLTRTQQLRALGNGVVPQQGVAALRLLLERAGLYVPLGVAA